ncbi:carbohydrate ABC transporter permease [Aggregatilinea lenta]|uniref:carbohydrate ABC transporter permease n=1 Tax=Aggregatilinea lenta TaxID=913108 RepID=UPI001EE81B56|nr:sugar ABC transporter permease [Aggregatilinea lenta]
MMVVSPVLLSLAAAVIGGAVLGLMFQRLRGSMLLGTALGAVAGAAGSLLFMLPLDYCTFEAERETIDRIFGYGLIGVGMAVVIAPIAWISARVLRGHSLISATSQPTQGTFKHGWMAFPLLAPTLIVLLGFLYYPSLETLRLSTRLARMGARREVFICVDNFTRLVNDASYWDIIGRTMYISILIVVISMALSLLIATMAYLPVKWASFYRVMLVWPYAISPAVAGIIFLLMFNPSGGIINHFLGDWFGIKPGWLNDPSVAPWTVILASVWKSMGFNILFYIAGLQNVPKDLLEAGSIDGAGVLRRFWHIVWPLLSPTTFFLIITNMTYAFFETFATIDYLTPGGGPLQSTTTMMYRVIQLGVDNNDLGKAAAQSIVLFLMVIGMTLVTFRTNGTKVTYGV